VLYCWSSAWGIVWRKVFDRVRTPAVSVSVIYISQRSKGCYEMHSLSTKLLHHAFPHLIILSLTQHNVSESIIKWGNEWTNHFVDSECIFIATHETWSESCRGQVNIPATLPALNSISISIPPPICLPPARMSLGDRLIFDHVVLCSHHTVESNTRTCSSYSRTPTTTTHDDPARTRSPTTLPEINAYKCRRDTWWVDFNKTLP